ncbi:MAG: tRNA dihydrouridine synthase DusB [Cardiobacteriaceae bacterium]|nr:tRNA dihydrouridine synthase DusB [Cardiobacteriaceae bacterium]
MTRTIKIGKWTYGGDFPALYLAPMAGISDLPFRRICLQCDCDVVVSEMTDARPELLATERTKRQIAFGDENAPKIVQLAGGNAYLMAEAARLMQDLGADAIDINMGCPAKRVGKQSAGSALLASPKLAVEIMNAVAGAVKIPVFLKTRIGFDEENINISDIAKAAEQAGVQAIAIHGRTRKQRFTGQARYEEIAAVRNEISIPVIVNGDINSVKKAIFLSKEYNFDGLMIGRAAIGNPWLFFEIKAEFAGEKYTIDPQKKRQMVQEHICAIHNFYTEKFGVPIARTHLHAYFIKDNNYLTVRDKINTANSADMQLAIIDEYLLQSE